MLIYHSLQSLAVPSAYSFAPTAGSQITSRIMGRTSDSFWVSNDSLCLKDLAPATCLYPGLPYFSIKTKQTNKPNEQTKTGKKNPEKPKLKPPKTLDFSLLAFWSTPMIFSQVTVVPLCPPSSSICHSVVFPQNSNLLSSLTWLTLRFSCILLCVGFYSQMFCSTNPTCLISLESQLHPLNSWIPAALPEIFSLPCCWETLGCKLRQ